MLIRWGHTVIQLNMAPSIPFYFYFLWCTENAQAHLARRELSVTLGYHCSCCWTSTGCEWLFLSPHALRTGKHTCTHSRDARTARTVKKFPCPCDVRVTSCFYATSISMPPALATPGFRALAQQFMPQHSCFRATRRHTAGVSTFVTSYLSCV